MYRSKQDVDKYVESLIAKTPLKEFNSRAYSIARLYYDLSDYTSCQKYVEQYISQKDNNAAAYKLLGQALHKLGQKEKALEQFKTSLSIDPAQTSLILEICELLADDEVIVDPGRAKYWCEKAEATFPRHPVTFRLRERLVSSTNSDPEALIDLLKSEISGYPKDVSLHARLLKHYVQNNKHKEAFDHSCKVEFGSNSFLNSYAWYETLQEVLKYQPSNIKSWDHQLLVLTVYERLCLLSLTESPPGNSKSVIESNKLLHLYDQVLDQVMQAGAPPGFPEFHSALMHHHRGQFVLHAATFLLKKAKKNQMSWREASSLAAPLMLIAWHTSPLSPKANWVVNASQLQAYSVRRWYLEGSFRCSQSGHYLFTNMHDKCHTFLDQMSQRYSGIHWKEKLYEKIFSHTEQLATKKSSHFLSKNYNDPALRLPRKAEIEEYDLEAQKLYPNSLHHMIWIILNYKNLSNFKCTLFDMLNPKLNNCSSCGPETLNKMDVLAFLCSATLTSQQLISQNVYNGLDKPNVVPANITDMYCSLAQIKWWDCAYKFIQNELGAELTDIRTTLTRGIEVVRCLDNHGMDPELLCKLGHIFSDYAKYSNNADEKENFEHRAGLYYSNAIPLLEKLKSKLTVKIPDKRMFDYTHKELHSKELNNLLEESKTYMGLTFMNTNDFNKAIDMLSNLKSPNAYFYLSKIYKKMAIEEYNITNGLDLPETKTKYASLLSKAKSFAYKALDTLNAIEDNKHPLYVTTQQNIEDIEILLNKVKGDIYNDSNNIEKVDSDGGSLESCEDGVDIPFYTHSNIFHKSSTPKRSMINTTNYRSAIDSQIFDTTRTDHKYLERIEKQIKNLQKRDSSINMFMHQTQSWIEENRNLGNQIMTTINSNILNTAEQFKLLKLSVDQVHNQLSECKSECKDVGELRKEVSELKKEIGKLKKSPSEQTIDENVLYNLHDDNRSTDTSASFPQQLPFNASQFIPPPFNQRFVPPFPLPPYQLHGQNLYNFYNQYAQLTQTPPVIGGIFDPSRHPLNYPGVYSTPEQLYTDMSHFIPPVVPTVSTCAPSVVTTTSASKPISSTIVPNKETRQLPVNVVITSSDPLPTSSSIPAPVLSVTIPPEHIKSTPHNYQIQMPTTGNEVPVIQPSLFTSSATDNTVNVSNTATQFASWNQANAFKTTQSSDSTPKINSFVENSPPMESNNTSSFFDMSATLSNSNSAVFNPNTMNKSRTLSEKSNTSVENYDPCPDFKPIIPLPAEVAITTGEENEVPIFSARAKLFRFVDQEWKERGLGEMKLLKHKVTGKVRVLMRREQIHKVCANHFITSDMEIKPMKNETKAYLWGANDFADENVVLEKFCIRFKTAEIAKQFYEVFENARKEAKAVIVSDTVTVGTSEPLKTDSVDNITLSNAGKPNKTVIGGFTFSSTPTFKTIKDDDPSDNKAQPETSKPNLFSSLSFKSTTTSPFSGVFNNLKEKEISSSNVFETPKVNTNESKSKLNTSDNSEEFEPTAEFKPIIPLPALIDQKTGEEDEIILFEYRAKLLRFDSSKQWKERGLGNIKLLVNKDDCQKVRLLMRREQVLKVCCNHAITKDMKFQKMPKSDKAITWCAKDFSEGELITETFCLLFKTPQKMEEFSDAIRSAQLKMEENANIVSDNPRNVAIKNNSGFGETFKPKPDSWQCETCYTNNLDNYQKCACCEQLKPEGDKVKVSEKQSLGGSIVSSFGNQFKPKPGSWECQQCFVRNEKSAECCSVCFNPKDPANVQQSANKDTNPVAQTVYKFKFGMPTEIASAENNKGTNWGDQFKPKPETWECQQCFVRNEANIDQCVACNSANPAVKKEGGSIFSNNKLETKFRFGIPQNQVIDQKPNVNSNISMPLKFNFNSEFKNKIESTSTLGGSLTSSPLFNATLIKSEQPVTITPSKPALLPTPQNKSEMTSQGDSFAASGSGKFEFVYKPKGKSPLKSPKSEKGEESDGNEYASEDEGHHIHFSPVIPMPDEIQVVSGEEDENEIYAHKAKLYRFTDSQWKERGCGVVKILKHKNTGQFRVLMRREQVHKICLNHALVPEITYSPKDDKTWLFAAHDFSEGQLALQSFCIRFANKQIATEFKEAIDNVCERKASKTDSDDIVFVSEIEASNEDKEKAKALMLPENFFTYEKKTPCRGCRGCSDEKDNENESAIKTPTKQYTSPSSLVSPAFSEYATPCTNNKTIDTPIFKSPLEVIAHNTQTDSTKDNSKEDNRKPVLAPTKLFGTKTKTEESNLETKSIFSAPKLNTMATSNIFGNTLGNKPLFSISNDSNKKDDDSKPEVKSIFGESDQKPVNIFSGGGSIFGNSLAQANWPSNTFKTQTDVKPTDKKPEQKTDISTFNFGKSDNLTFASLSADAATFQKQADFTWEGTGQQIFSNTSNNSTTKDVSGDGNKSIEDEYDPHYEPIVPLPEKIVVTTGEEDEEKMFSELCKLYRFDEKTKEWKERALGEMKVLYHAQRKSYRLLLRRAQVHHTVLNMLLFIDFELLPMKNSEKAWTWACHNFAEKPEGENETLAVRFKSIDLANKFKTLIDSCVRKLQANAAQAIREGNEGITPKVEPTLPIESTAAPKVQDAPSTYQQPKNSTDDYKTEQNGSIDKSSVAKPHVHFEEQNYDDDEDDDEEDESNDEETEDGYDEYNYDEDQCFVSDAEVTVKHPHEMIRCKGQVQVVFDPSINASTIYVTDVSTGEIVAHMYITPEIEIKLNDEICNWVAVDITSNKTKDVTVKFPNADVAVQFYDACETNKYE